MSANAYLNIVLRRHHYPNRRARFKQAKCFVLGSASSSGAISSVVLNGARGRFSTRSTYTITKVSRGMPGIHCSCGESPGPTRARRKPCGLVARGNHEARRRTGGLSGRADDGFVLRGCGGARRR